MANENEIILKEGQIINIDTDNIGLLVDQYGFIFERAGENQVCVLQDNIVKYDGDKRLLLKKKDNGWEEIKVNRDNIKKKNNSKVKQSKKIVVKNGSQQNNKKVNENKKKRINYNIPQTTDTTFRMSPELIKKQLQLEKQWFGGEQQAGELGEETEKSVAMTQEEEEPMNRRMLGNQLDDFLKKINATDGVKMEHDSFDCYEFKKKIEDRIKDCDLLIYKNLDDKKKESLFAGTSIGKYKYYKKRYHLWKKDDRMALMTVAKTVRQKRDDALLISNEFSSLKSLSVDKCLRYVGYLAVLDRLEELRDFEYKDVGTKKGENLLGAVNDCLEFLDASEDKSLKKRKNFVSALNIWKSEYQKLAKALKDSGEAEFERIVNNNGVVHHNLNEQNKARANGHWDRPF